MSPRCFRWLAIGWSLLVALACYWPLTADKTPLPEEIVMNVALFDGVQPPSAPIPHAELSDSVEQFYPWRQYLGRSLRSGHLPLWNRHLLLGIPFLADPQAGVLYPGNLLFWLFPPSLAWGLAFVIHVVVLVFFTAEFGRDIGLSPPGSLTAATVFAFSGFMVDYGADLAQMDSVIWLPLILLSVNRLLARPGRRSIAIAAIAFSLPVLAGHPEVALFVDLFGCVYWIFRLFSRPEAPGSLAAPILSFLAVGALALSLSAAQLIPTLEYIPRLHRGIGRFFEPGAIQNLAGFLCRQNRTDLTAFHTAVFSSLYSGSLTLLAAPLALLANRKRITIFFGLAFAIALDVSFGVSPLGRAIGRLPVMAGTRKEFMISIAEFSIAILAGMGITAAERLRHESLRALRLARFTLWGAFAVALAALLLLVRRYPTPPEVRFLESPVVTGILLVGSFCLLMRLLAGTRPGRWGGIAVLGLVAADMITYSFGHVPFVPRKDLLPEPLAYRWLHSHDRGIYRIAALDGASNVNTEMFYGFESPGGYQYLLRPTLRFLDPLRDKDVPPEWTLYWMQFTTNGEMSEAGRRMDLANVKYFLTTTYNSAASTLLSHPERFRPVYGYGALRVFENLRALPRAFFVPAENTVVANSDEEADRKLSDPGFDPSSSAILDGGEPMAERAAGRPGESGSVRNWAQSVNSATADVEVAAPSLLVISQAFYPGWKAYVDGVANPVRRVDLALSGLLVPKGSHRVRLVFAPATFQVGLLMSLAAAGVIAALLIAPRSSSF